MLHGGIMASDHSAVHLSPYPMFRRRPRVEDVDRKNSTSRCLFGVPDPIEAHAAFRRVQDKAILDFESRWNFDPRIGVPGPHVKVAGSEEMKYCWTQVVPEDASELQELAENESITPPNSPALLSVRPELTLVTTPVSTPGPTTMLTPESIEPELLSITTSEPVTPEPLSMLTPECVTPELMPMLTSEALTPESLPLLSDSIADESMPILTPEETSEPSTKARMVERISVSPIQYFCPPNVDMGSQSSDEDGSLSPVGLESNRFVAISASTSVPQCRRFMSSSTSAAPSLKQRCITDYMKVKKASRSGKKVLR